MKKFLFPFLGLITLVSCSDGVDRVTCMNDFVLKKGIDTLQYETLYDLSRNNILENIELEQYYFNPLVDSITQTVILEKRSKHGKDYRMFYVLNRDGNTIDSLVLKGNYTLLEGFLITKDNYTSWFRDQDKSLKPFAVLDKTSKDSSAIKELVAKIRTKHLLVYINKDLSSRFIEADTLNFAMVVENQKIYKIALMEKDSVLFGLPLSTTGTGYGSDEFLGTHLKEISEIPMGSRGIVLDDFFAKTKNSGPEPGLKFNLSFGHGGSVGPSYPYYSGTAFLKVPSLGLRFKTSCDVYEEEPFMYPFYEIDFPIYTKPFLNFSFIKSDISGKFYLCKNRKK